MKITTLTYLDGKFGIGSDSAPSQFARLKNNDQIYAIILPTFGPGPEAMANERALRTNEKEDLEMANKILWAWMNIWGGAK
jgi:hypothetical protein